MPVQLLNDATVFGPSSPPNKTAPIPNNAHLPPLPPPTPMANPLFTWGAHNAELLALYNSCLLRGSTLEEKCLSHSPWECWEKVSFGAKQALSVLAMLRAPL